MSYKVVFLKPWPKWQFENLFDFCAVALHSVPVGGHSENYKSDLKFVKSYLKGLLEDVVKWFLNKGCHFG